MKPLGLYIHIPFCPYRCHYCDFLSFTGQEEAIPLYVDALMDDLRGYSADLKDRRIISVFFGGGTPSLLSPEQVGKILSCVRELFSMNEDVEITLESNPGTLTAEKLLGFRKAGVNRISLGVQAIQDHHLRRMGRIHTAAEAREAFNLGRESGFKNINIDLISGLPDQTLEEWRDSLDKVLEWEPDHLSAYGLQIEEGTPFSSDLKSGRLVVPGEETEALMYEAALDAAVRHGMEQYEISNFSRPRKPCVHNLIYWRNEEYLGIGLGAVSYLNRKRFWMTRNLAKYISGEERVIGSEILSVPGEMGETLMLGLRLNKGIESDRFQQRFGTTLQDQYGELLSRLEESAFVRWDLGHLSLTPAGRLVANEIVSRFLQPADSGLDTAGSSRCPRTGTHPSG